MGAFFGLVALSIDPPEVVTGAAWVGISVAVGAAFGLAAGLLALPVLTPRVHAALRGWGVVWLPALVWAGIEYLRLVTTAGHQWGMTATAQIDTAPLRAFLPLAGMWPVTIIVMATNGAIAALVLAGLGRWIGSRRALGWSVGAVAAAWICGGILALVPSRQLQQAPCARLWCNWASTCPTIRSHAPASCAANTPSSPTSSRPFTRPRRSRRRARNSWFGRRRPAGSIP